MWAKIWRYVASIGLALGVGALSAAASGGGMGFYETIVRPPLSPPGLLFPIVWTVLYILMGISAAMVSGKRGQMPKEVNEALGIYLLSLGVNFAWSPLFFGYRFYLFAFFWLLLLLYLIIRTILAYRQISKTAALLQIPYALWVVFAGYLNFAIWVLNR